MVDAHFHQWLKILSTASHDMPSSAQDVRAKFTRFRMLVVGKANLQKVCNATGKPEIFDGKGNKINADVAKPSVDILCTYAL
ncbi:hypothetical protein M405DRAFT_866426 [Rhizopogon salebrosus TDB-379]|nr:hypothetical protein M405DRAFT_866426 [Rhizopogon salebrosus TDB-379]